MSRGRGKFGDSAHVGIIRAGGTGAERRAPSGDGLRLMGRYDVDFFSSGIVVANKPLRDIYRTRVLAGRQVKLHRKTIRKLLAAGVVREVLTPSRLFDHDVAYNLVTNEGLDHVLDVILSGGTADTTWFVGLTDNSPTPAAADTLASHGGWVEFSEYTGTRQAFVDGGVSAQSLDNSASTADFPIDNDTNGGLGGCFLAGSTSGTTQVLFSAVALTGGNRVVNNGDTVEVTYTFTAADDGA